MKDFSKSDVQHGRNIDHFGQRWWDQGSNIHVHRLKISRSVKGEKDRALVVPLQRQQCAVIASQPYVHRSVGAVENSVVVPKERHAQNPHRSKLGNHVHLHKSGHAHVDRPDLGLEEENVPYVTRFEDSSFNPHHVCPWRKFQIMATNVERQCGQLVKIRAVFHDGLDLRAEQHQLVARSSNERCPAVKNGRTPLGTRHFRSIFVKSHIMKVTNPMIFASDFYRGEACGFWRGLHGRPPRKKSTRSNWFLKTNGKLFHTIRGQQSLFRMALCKIRTNTHDGSKLCGIEDSDAVVDYLPERLVRRSKRTNRNFLITHHRHARSRSVNMLRNTAVRLVGLTQHPIVWWCWMNTRITSSRPHQQLKRSSVKNTCNALVANCEISKILDVLVIVQFLPEGFQGLQVRRCLWLNGRCRWSRFPCAWIS
mmetsp:Transcript_51568/g.137631  ORF Transcript_51568/g.137631 Transcript_51568/m.137631 type:complete len:423 (+) Transcript_51568:359-1627(+)